MHKLILIILTCIIIAYGCTGKEDIQTIPDKTTITKVNLDKIIITNTHLNNKYLIGVIHNSDHSGYAYKLNGKLYCNDIVTGYLHIIGDPLKYLYSSNSITTFNNLYPKSTGIFFVNTSDICTTNNIHIELYYDENQSDSINTTHSNIIIKNALIENNLISIIIENIGTMYATHIQVMTLYLYNNQMVDIQYDWVGKQNNKLFPNSLIEYEIRVRTEEVFTTYMQFVFWSDFDQILPPSPWP